MQNQFLCSSLSSLFRPIFLSLSQIGLRFAAAGGGRRSMRRIPSLFRAPPPTPIATGKGRRSAAVDDRLLTEFLETSLRVPDLSLPVSYFASRSPVKPPAEVDISALASGDERAVRRVLDAAAEVGAVRIIGVADSPQEMEEEVRAAIEAARDVFGTSEEKKQELGARWFGRREGFGEEFYWYHLRSPETDHLLERTWPDTYQILCDKMENVAARLENVADCIAKILADHVKNQTPSKRLGKVQSILCLRKYESHHNRDNIREYSDVKSFHSHALSLHICAEKRRFCIRHPEGSSFFDLPAGSILVTIGKPLQDWCNWELKSATGEIVFEPTDDPSSSFSLEFMCSPPALSRELDQRDKTLSIMDQLLVAIVIAFIYNFWACLLSRFG